MNLERVDAAPSLRTCIVRRSTLTTVGFYVNTLKATHEKDTGLKCNLPRPHMHGPTGAFQGPSVQRSPRAAKPWHKLGSLPRRLVGEDATPHTVCGGVTTTECRQLQPVRRKRFSARIGRPTGVVAWRGCGCWCSMQYTGRQPRRALLVEHETRRAAAA